MNRFTEVFFDLETVGVPEGPIIQEQIAQIERERESDLRQVKPAGNLIDPVKIKASVKKKETDIKVKAIGKTADIINKAALSPLTGQIIVAGMGMRSEDFTETEIGTFIGREGEGALLEQIDQIFYDTSPTRIVTFNGRGFDIPYLAARYMANRIKPKFSIPLEKWDKRHLDVFETLGRKGSLHNWSLAMTGSGTTGSGSQVAKWFNDGDWSSISEHCHSDIEKLIAIYDLLRPIMYGSEREA